VKAPAFPAENYPDSGNRLPQPKREDMSDPDRKIFDEIMTALRGGYKSRGGDRAAIRLHSPKPAHAMAQVHRYLMGAIAPRRGGKDGGSVGTAMHNSMGGLS
jgi:hypothetical protein